MINKAPGADCQNCTLRDQPLVNGFGPKDASLIVVGEAPGAQEASIGQPFIGKSGQLIRKVLNHYGVDDENVYWTNVCLCRPPENRKPKATEVKACSGRLRQELQSLTGARKIIALGGTASKALTGRRESITQLRLSGEQESIVEGLTVIPTYHPAAALRNADLLPTIFNDLKGISTGASVEWEPTKWRAYEDAEGALRAISALSRYPPTRSRR